MALSLAGMPTRQQPFADPAASGTAERPHEFADTRVFRAKGEAAFANFSMKVCCPHARYGIAGVPRARIGMATGK